MKENPINKWDKWGNINPPHPKYPDYDSWEKIKKPVSVNPLDQLSALLNSWTIGFDRHFKIMEELRAQGQSIKPSTYPPYNIKCLKDLDKYEVELAVAGFSKSDITVEQIENKLSVKGSKDSADETYLHKGLAARDFEQTFVLADYVKVTKVTLIDGILTIHLEREVPEEKKPKVIPISSK